MPDPDTDTLREIAAAIQTLNETLAHLRELGEDAGLPAVERNAKRMQGVASTLEDNVPRELYEE